MKKVEKFSLMAFLLILLTPALAFAAEEQVVWQVILQHLLEIVVAIAVPVLGTLIHVMLKKWGIKVQMETLDNVLSKAIGFAEQKAYVALKKGEPKTDSATKLDWALTKGQELAKDNKLDQWVVDKLEDLIEAKLGEQSKEVTTSASTGSV